MTAAYPVPEVRPDEFIEPDEERQVIRAVLKSLGRPRDLHRVTAEKLWDRQYRVNIYRATETDRPVRSVTMSDSFFVTLTDDGIRSNPPIDRKYG